MLRRSAVPRTGTSPRFLGWVGAYAVSTYGNFLNLIALSLLSYEVTGSPLGIGLLMALRLVSGVLMGLVAGTLVTRFNRRKLMVCTDTAQALAMAALLPGGEASALPLLCGVVVVLGAGNTLFTVSLRSAVPEMVGQRDRIRANGRLVTARSLATVLGFASAGPVISVGGFRTAFAVNAVSFLISAVTLLLVRLRTNAPRQRDGSGPDDHSERGTSRSGLRTLHAIPALLLGMIALRGMDALGSSSHNVALPVVAKLVDPSDPAAYMSQFWAAWAVGSLLSHHLVSRWWKQRGGGPSERSFAVGMGLMSLFFVVAFTGLDAPPLIGVSVAAGMADGFTEIAYTSRLQAAPDAQRGHLFGLSAIAETSGFALGTVMAAATLEALPPLVVVGLFHGVALLAAAVFLLFLALSPRTRRAHKAPHNGENTTEHLVPGA